MPSFVGLTGRREPLLYAPHQVRLQGKKAAAEFEQRMRLIDRIKRATFVAAVGLLTLITAAWAAFLVWVLWQLPHWFR